MRDKGQTGLVLRVSPWRGSIAWVVDQYRRIEGVEAGPSGTRTNNLTRYLDGENGEMEV